MNRNDWLIVGIGGCTCSGKSSIAKTLVELIPQSVLIQQDDFFYQETDSRHVKVEQLNHVNFEVLTSLDMEGMLLKINDVLNEPCSPTEVSKNAFKNNLKSAMFNKEDALIEMADKLETLPRVLILEGFLILNDSKVSDLCDIKFYFMLDKETCWARRKVRTYDPPDPPKYFDMCVWPHYLVHKEKVQEKVDDVLWVEGADKWDKNFELVTFHVIKHLLSVLSIPSN